jgi:hypothetical protein
MKAPVQPQITAPHLIRVWLWTYQSATWSAVQAGFFGGTCCSRKMKAKILGDGEADPPPHDSALTAH